MRILRQAAIFSAFLVLLPLGARPVFGEPSREQLEHDKKQNQKALDESDRELKRLDKQIAELRVQAGTIDKRIKVTQLELDRAVANVRAQQARVALVKEEVRALGGRITTTNRNIEKTREHLRRRAQALMKLSRLQNLDFLARSGDAAEFELRMRLLDHVAEGDAGLVRRTVEAKRELENDKAEKQDVLKRLVDEERRLTAAKNAVASKQAELAQLKRQVVANAASAAEKKKQIQEAMRQIRSKISAIDQAMKTRLKAYKAPSNFSRPTGGQYFRPIDALDGVYIRTNYGSGVNVIAEGQVVSVQEMHGMGLTVIVGHGGDLTSVYANLSDVTVSAGEKLAARASVGKSGHSPYGEAIYFAVYKNGSAQDPMRYQ